MKDFFKNWSLLEILFLICSLLILTICFIFSNDKNYLSLIVSLLGIITVLCGSKALIVAPLFNLLYSILYLYISFSSKYYGEVLIYIFLMIPLNIITVVSWLRNKNKDNDSVVEINKLKLKEYALLILIAIPVSIGFYFLLKYLNTVPLLVSTLSLTATLIASYLYYRRSSNYAIAYICNDFILIYLWGLSLTKSMDYLPMVITFFVFFLNDLYGLINWKRMEKNSK